MFDIKLVNGQYFKNIELWDYDLGLFEDIEFILNRDDKMQIYYRNDEKGDNLLAEVNSDDIEYICKSYIYEEEKI